MCDADVLYTLFILQDILPQRSEKVRTLQAIVRMWRSRIPHWRRVHLSTMHLRTRG